MKATLQKHAVKVADEVWLAIANLHHAHPERFDFSVDEIRKEVARLKLSEFIRPGVQIHLSVHCIANKAPNPGRYRMLIETTPGRRRLYREGDHFHKDRTGGKVTPSREHIPAKFRFLLDWYKNHFVEKKSGPPIQGVPGSVLLQFVGLIPKEDAREMARIIEEDFGRIEYENW